MLDEQTTPASEVNESEETVNDEQAETTIGESVGDETPVSDSIPKKRFDEVNEKRKVAEARIAELEAATGEDPEKPDSKETDSDLAARLAKLEGKEKAEKLEATMESNFAKALEEAPEFKDKVNMEVLKREAQNPANANKTYSQLLEEVYGNTISGTRTAETTTPRGGAENQTLDLARAGSDNAYLEEVLKDPALKKQYNDGLAERVML